MKGRRRPEQRRNRRNETETKAKYLVGQAERVRQRFGKDNPTRTKDSIANQKASRRVNLETLKGLEQQGSDQRGDGNAQDDKGQELDPEPNAEYVQGYGRKTPHNDACPERTSWIMGPGVGPRQRFRPWPPCGRQSLELHDET